MRRVVTVADVTVGLAADSPARWRAMDALFGRCPDADGTPAMAVTFGADPLSPPTAPPAASWADVELWFTDDGAVTRHASGIVARRVGDDVLVGEAASGSPAAESLARAFRRSAQHVLADAMAQRGRYALHAAVVAQDGTAIVIIGDTGAGKSTLAVAALERGWSVLTDDIAWLANDGTTVLVWGFPKPLHVPADLTDRVPIGATRLADDARQRVIVPNAVTSSDRALPLLGVVVVEHGEQDGSLEDHESGAGLVTLLMRSYPLQASPDGVRRFFPVAVRASARPAAVLAHARDPRRRLARAGELLEDARARFGGPGQ